VSVSFGIIPTGPPHPAMAARISRHFPKVGLWSRLRSS
jgi:hypothetical protein